MAWDFVANIKGVKGDIGNLYVGQIPSGANLNTYVGPAFAGSYGVPLQSIVDGLVNAPAGARPGTFTVLPVGSTASTHIWIEYLAPGRMFVSGVSVSGRTAPWKDVFAADDGGNFVSSGFTTFDQIDKNSNFSVWSGSQAAAAGAPIPQVGEIRTYVFGTAGIQTYTSTNTVLGAQVFVRGKGSAGWGTFKEVTNQPGNASPVAPQQSGFKNAYLALNQPATSGTEAVSAATVRWPIKNGVASKRARLHVRNWNIATGTTYGAASFTGAWMGQASGKDFTGTPVQVLPAFNTASNGAEYISPWFNYDMVADVQHLLSVGFTTTAGQTNQASRGGSYRSTVPADASLATGFTGTTSTTSPFDVWLELEVPASTPIVAGFGDSNTVGTGTTLPVYDSWLNQYARTAKALPYFAAIHGSNTGTWENDNSPIWGRASEAARPDAVVNFLGQNDLVEGVTLATLQANFNKLLPIIREKLSTEVFVATITPADAKSAPVNTVRQAYNAWLKTLPGGVKDAFDFSAAVSDDDATIRPADNADGLHLVTGGHTKIATALSVRPVAPAAVAKGDTGAPGVGVPTGGAALQLLRKDAAGTGTEWATPSKALVGLSNVDNTADLDKPVSALGIQALGLKVSKGEIVVNPRDFGATGDGITDDTAAIQAAVNSIEGIPASSGGGTVALDYGNYVVSSTITIAKPGTHLTATGAFTANIMPTATMTGPVFKFAIPNTYFRGPRVSNLRLYMNGSTASGIRFESAYDNVMLENVFIDNLGGATNGFEFVAATGAPSVVSQTITAINCWASGARSGNVFTGHAWHLEDVQEAVFTSCKGFGGGEGQGTAWYLKGVRGVNLYGCSAAFAGIGLTLDSTSRSILGVTIDGPTLESLTNTITTTGTNNISYVALRNPRSQVGDTIAAGPIALNYVTQSTFETHSIVISVGTNTSQVTVFTDDNTKVTNTGPSTTVVQGKNATKPYTVGPQLAVESDNTPYARLAVTGRTGYWQDQWGASSSTDGGFLKRYWDGAAWRNAHAVDAGGTRHRFYVWNGTAAVESAAVTASPATQKTGLWLMVNDGTTTTLKQVEVGAVDSGGTGYRTIRVAN